MSRASAQLPIGILDSGVGGLSVLRHVRLQLPAENLLYFADQAHIPYGPRSTEEVRRFVEEITRFLMERGAKLIVVACNAASAATLDHLRATFKDIPFVGMEPAVKPGAVQTRTGKIGVLATSGTLNSRRYARLLSRFAEGISAFEDPCPGLVEQIEAGQVDAPETEQILRNALTPMIEGGVDTVVLGCTHYPFVLPLIEKVVGNRVTIMDPAPAVARQVRRVLEEFRLLAERRVPGRVWAFTSAEPERLKQLSQLLLDRPIQSTAVSWRSDGALSR
jgi:glutamate racemase